MVKKLSFFPFLDPKKLLQKTPKKQNKILPKKEKKQGKLKNETFIPNLLINLVIPMPMRFIIFTHIKVNFIQE